MSVALYARVSTEEQSCDLQLAELREYCLRKHWEIHQEYVDTGISGKKSTRPALDRLMKDARLARFDTVIVWKLDRWGRSAAHSIGSIQELTRLGIRWVALIDNLDTDESSPVSRFFLHVMAAFAELERETIKERVRAGIKNAHARGVAFGRPKRIFDREEVGRLRGQGLSIREISVKMGIGKGSVQRALGSRPQSDIATP